MPTALVTGGTRGIGRAIGRALACAGFDIASVSMETPPEADESVAEIRSFGRNAIYCQQDIADIDSHAGLLRSISNELGAIDCLVNNAGVTSKLRADMLDLSPESFDRCLGVNLRGTFFLTQAVAHGMMASRPRSTQTYRSIVTISSANAEIVGLDRADYCISKAGVSMTSKLFAARLAEHAIHVFEVRPGIIRTDMTAPATAKYDHLIAQGGVPLARWGTPDDVGRTVAAIALGSMPYATGEVINVGGGLHLHRL